MNKLRLPRGVIALALLALKAHANTYSVPAEANPTYGSMSRVTTWTPGVTVGVPGGIPVRTHLVDVTKAPYNADNTGTTDASAAIISAINAANPNDVIFLPAGRYLILNSIAPTNPAKSNYTVRGVGDATVLLWNGTTSGCFSIGSGSDYNWPRPTAAGVAITGGNYAQGATVLNVASTTNVVNGGMIRITQNNDMAQPVIHVSGYTKQRQQLENVVSHTATTITISPGLAWPLIGSLNPVYNYAAIQANGVGLENFKIDATASTNNADYGVYMEQCYGCWLYNVHIYNVLNYHLYMWDCLNCQVEHCYLDTLNHQGSNGSGLYGYTMCYSLVENNIVAHSFPNIELNEGCTANVFGYNFVYDSNSDGEPGASIDLVHAPHNSFNLVEGNAAPNVQADSFFGSASEDTIFRNWLYGLEPESVSSVRQPIILNRFVRYDNVIGNLLGAKGYIYFSQPKPLTNQGPYAFGLPNIGNTGYTGNLGGSPSILGTTVSLLANDPWEDWNLPGTLASTTTITMTNGFGDLAPPQFNQLSFTWAGGNIWDDATLVSLNTGTQTLTFSNGSGNTLPQIGTAVQVWPGPDGFQEFDLDVQTTTILTGNYDVEGIPNATPAVAPGEPAADTPLNGATLPNSFYLSGAPAWFGNLPWPAYKVEAPDTNILNGVTDTNGYQEGYYDIPAGYRFTHGLIDPLGVSPLTSQPSSASAALGATAEFAVATEGTPTYQWQVSTNGGANWSNLVDGALNGATYAGSLTATLNVSSITTAQDANQYQCVVTYTSPAVTVTSNVATLSVEYAPIFTTQPTAATINAGSSTTFTTAVSADPAATYQWQVSTNGGVNWANVSNGALYSNVTTSALTVTGATASMNGYEYQLVATNSVGPTDSSAALLTVDYAPSFTTQPTSASVTAGNNITLTSAASGNPAPTYQWQVSTNGGGTWAPVTNGGVYSNATTSSLTITGATAAMNLYEYEVIATNSVAPTTSNAATLTVDFAPSFTTQPAPTTTVDAGGNVTLTASTSADPAATYQWKVSTDGGAFTSISNSGVYSGATTSSLVITGATAALNGDAYELVATNSVGNQASSAADLTVDFGPSFTAQPSAQTVQAGGTATFTAAVSANPAATYQWQVSTNGGGTWTPLQNAGIYSGVTTATLTITQAPSSLNTNLYQLVASNTLGTVDSNTAALTVDYAATFGTEPTADTVVEGNNAVFDVSATANPSPTYEWQISTDDGAVWTNLSNNATYGGVTTDQLTITDTTLSMNGDEFRSVATNLVSPVDSSAATLTVELNTPSVTSALSDAVTLNLAFSYTITGTNSPTSFNATGLPTGLSINTATGAITGTPTVAGYYSVAISATNAHGTGTATLNLAVSPAAAPVINSTTSATVLGGSQFSYTITGTNYPSSFATTTLPTGLTLNPANGVISGVPTVGGTYQITLSATNPTGTGTGPLTITVETMPPPVITSPSTATGQVGTLFSYQIAGSNSPFILSAINLPPGLTVNSGTGVISGIPTQTGTFTSTLQVTNSTGTTTGPLTTTIVAGNQIYLGNLGGGAGGSGAGNGNGPRTTSVGGSIAAYVNGNSGTLIGYISSIQAGFLVNFTLVNGTFTAQTTSLTSNGAGQTLTFNGSITNSTLSGTIVELNLPFSAPVDPVVGTSSAVSGLYASGSVYSVVGTQGEVYVLAVTASGVAAGTGTVDANGQFSVQTSEGITVTASVNSQSGISGAISATGQTSFVTFSGSSAAGAPQITPASQTVMAGATVTLSAATSGATAYQWQYYGSNIAGATSSTYTIPNIGEYQGGVFNAVVTTGSGTLTSTPATVAVDVNARLVNLSGSAYVGTGAENLIAGFIVSGSGNKDVLLRGVGPALGGFDVAAALSKASLTLFDNTATEIATDTGWTNPFQLGTSTVEATIASATTSLFNQVGAFALSLGSADSALQVTVPAGSYSEQVTGVGGSQGIALAEIYDADTGTPTATLSNISLRSFAGTGQEASTVGFAIGGTTSETVLLRGVGPALASFGISGPLAQPQLVLYDHEGKVIATNIGWANAPQSGTSSVAAGLAKATSQIMARVYAFALPTGSADCAMVVTLPPGTYSAAVTGVNGTTGAAMVEIYDVP